MGLRGWATETFGRREADAARKGKRGMAAMKFLQFLDGYKRVLALLTYVIEGIAQAAGLGDHTAGIGVVFRILRWDPAGMGVEIGPALQAGFTLWAILDGLRKANAQRKLEQAAKAAAVALLLCLTLPTALACRATGQFAVNPKTVEPDQDTVDALVCRGAIERAEVYLGDRNASRAEIVERIERAAKKAFKRPDCCIAAGCGSRPGAAPVTPTLSMGGEQ